MLSIGLLIGWELDFLNTLLSLTRESGKNKVKSCRLANIFPRVEETDILLLFSCPAGRRWRNESSGLRTGKLVFTGLVC